MSSLNINQAIVLRGDEHLVNKRIKINQYIKTFKITQTVHPLNYYMDSIVYF